MLPLFRTLIPEDGIVLDVGGHAGQYAKLYAKAAKNGHVYSFEPGRYACSILRRALDHNSRYNTTVVPQGLGEAIGEIDLNIPMKKNGVVKYGVSHMGDTSNYEFVKTETAQINTIDDFVDQQGLTRLDFIKADIEGWEQRMVIGGERSIRKFNPVLMLEMMDHQLHRAGDTLEGFWALLLSWGYKPYVCSENNILQLELVENSRDSDIFWISDK
jgi:FkbM family methyltransferase